jgi:transposase
MGAAVARGHRRRPHPAATPRSVSCGWVDLGIIHPYAAVADEAALLVSGRAIRAESYLHLRDQQARHARAARRAPKPGQRGSRRWRRHRLRVRREEARHRRRVHQAQHEAAKQVIAFAVRQGVGTGHRDLVGAANIAATHGGGPTSTALPVLVEHRRAGIVPARRDRRRHQHESAPTAVLPGLGPPSRAKAVGWVSLAARSFPPCARRGSSNPAQHGPRLLKEH